MSRLNQAKEALLRAGGVLNSSALRGALVRADNRAKREAKELAAPPNKRAAELIVSGLGWLAVAFFFLVLLLGVGLLLIVIPAAEAQAVYNGLLAITPIPEVAILTTAALFIGVVVLMFMKNIYEDALPNGKPVTGLRRLAYSLLAWIGHADSIAWIETHRFSKVESDYLFLFSALGLTKFAIIGASLVGRLKRVLDAHGSKPLGEAWSELQATLTGREFTDVIVSLVVLYAMLKALDMGVLFCFTAFRNSAGKLDLAEFRPTDFLDSYSILKEQYTVEAIEEETMKLTIAQEQKNEDS